MWGKQKQCQKETRCNTKTANKKTSKKKTKKSKVIKPFPSIKPNNTQQQTKQTTIPSTATNSLPKNNNVSASSFSAKDISDMQNDLVQKQQALQPIKPTPSF